MTGGAPFSAGQCAMQTLARHCSIRCYTAPARFAQTFCPLRPMKRSQQVRQEMNHRKPWALLLFLLAVLPAIAYAQWAYTAKDVNLRAGPARDYPVVARLPGGLEISVAGWLND